MKVIKIKNNLIFKYDDNDLIKPIKNGFIITTVGLFFLIKFLILRGFIDIRAIKSLLKECENE